MRKQITVLAWITLSVLAACGPNTTTRATTGAAAGALAAGPVGAVAGAALGASGTVQIR
ncbi:hypothetical protein [Paracoccus marinaquae]|uniref:Lipoprotein n=1 Tax=Paracoccus marinaquae TaxID=2841926 RepID=A0ABS6AEW5_9RHOB|nr:hypothetical protein [Paracoccus marinaquae]MBU3029153.1 hypothetical protein [Paracoccus marinaquae]